MLSPIRILTAVPICDGHDSAINTINLEFIRHGIEVIYLGYHRPVADIVRAAIQEDVRAIGISSYNGGHIEFFAAVVDLLRKKGANDIKVFGGGGTITHDDAATMRRKGVDEIFFAGTSLDDMVKFVHRRYGKPRAKRPRPKSSDQELAHELSEIEEAYGIGNRKRRTQKAKIANRKSQITNHKCKEESADLLPTLAPQTGRWFPRLANVGYNSVSHASHRRPSSRPVSLR